MRATVIMEDGKSLDKEKVKAALEKNRLGFVSLEEVERPLPKAAYVLKSPGIG